MANAVFVAVSEGTTEMTANPSSWLTPKEGAAHLKVKPRTLLLWARQGKLKAYSLSGVKRRIWRFRKEDLDAALMASPVLPSIPLSVRSPEGRTS
jgi:excisionase family DNA binding protein